MDPQIKSAIQAAIAAGDTSTVATWAANFGMTSARLAQFVAQ